MLKKVIAMLLTSIMVLSSFICSYAEGEEINWLNIFEKKLEQDGAV